MRRQPFVNARATLAENLTLTVAAGLGMGFAIVLALMLSMHVWGFDAGGRPIPLDFVAFWSAGRLALRGAAISAYDPVLQHAAEVATVGHPIRNVYGWSYPPLFLMVAAALASAPYTYALVAWNGITLALHGSVIAATTRRGVTFFAAAAAPWAMLNMIGGQNGLLTAAGIGAVLLTLDRRPAMSGFLLGMLTYKPQFGLLFPVVLMAGRHWKTFLWAAGSAAFWMAISCAIFGAATLSAFLGSLVHTAQTHLVTNNVGAWAGGLQSPYGAARWLGASNTVSWAFQLCVSLSCALAIARLWSSPTLAVELKAAALAALSPLVTPYVFVYDLPVLSVATAFLFRQRPFDRQECLVLALALLSVAAFVVHPYPAGVLACCGIGFMVFRRVAGARKLARPATVSTPQLVPATPP